MPLSVCLCTAFSWSRVRAKTLRLAAPCGPSGSLRSGNPIASRRAHLYSASSALKTKRFAPTTSRTSREPTNSPPDHYSTCFCLFCMVETLIHFSWFTNSKSERNTDASIVQLNAHTLWAFTLANNVSVLRCDFFRTVIAFFDIICHISGCYRTSVRVLR